AMRLALPASAPSAVYSMPLLIAAFCVLWSSAFAVAKLALTDCPPLLLLMARFLLAGTIILGVTALQSGQRHLARRDILILSLLGVANNSIYLGLNYVGMQSISAGLSALIVSANPVATAVLAAIFLKEQMTWRKVAGLLLGIGGVAFVIEGRTMSGIDSLTGVAFTIAALLSLVGGTILFKRLSPNGGLWIGNGVQNLAAGLALAPFAVGIEPVGDIVPSWRLFIALAYLVLQSTQSKTDQSTLHCSMRSLLNSPRAWSVSLGMGAEELEQQCVVGLDLCLRKVMAAMVELDETRMCNLLGNQLAQLPWNEEIICGSNQQRRVADTAQAFS